LTPGVTPVRMTVVPIATANGFDLWYETIGADDAPPLLLVMGLGAQAIHWPDDFCHGLADRGFRVIRFDNRDAGLSSEHDAPPVDLLAAAVAHASGEPVEAPYVIADLAADAIGLLDALGVARAHVVGASLGGMIAQQMAIDAPGRMATLTSIMSTTGDPDVGQPSPDAMAVLLTPVAPGRDAAIDATVRSTLVIGSPGLVDVDEVRRRAAEAYDRSSRPEGMVRQLVAIAASGSRADGLRSLAVPTLVIHGDVDPLIDVSGGRRTAELVPGADLLVIAGMGHDLVPAHWAPIIEAITAHVARHPA